MTLWMKEGWIYCVNCFWITFLNFQTYMPSRGNLQIYTKHCLSTDLGENKRLNEANIFAERSKYSVNIALEFIWRKCLGIYFKCTKYCLILTIRKWVTKWFNCAYAEIWLKNQEQVARVRGKRTIMWYHESQNKHSICKGS